MRNIKVILLVLVFIASLGTQTIPLQKPVNAYRGSVFKTQSEEVISLLDEPPPIRIVEETTTTMTQVVTTTTIKTITTTSTTIFVVINVDGPPHNLTTLVGCISYYESSWGKDPNVFQFTQDTWEHYGGAGSPSKASYSRQEELFWIAWVDDGHHHWAAQKGRCF